MNYYSKYIKYKKLYLTNRNKMIGGGDKFKVGDKVKRIKGNPVEDANGNMRPPEAVGMTGTIQFIQEAGEWPPGSGKIMPKRYVINFPELYKGTKYAGVMLGVIEEELELVPSFTTDSKFKVGDKVKLWDSTGIIRELWVGSDVEKQSKIVGLDKYLVEILSGDVKGNTWVYGYDLKKIQ